jgi:hypothetical protein
MSSRVCVVLETLGFDTNFDIDMLQFKASLLQVLKLWRSCLKPSNHNHSWLISIVEGILTCRETGEVILESDNLGSDRG